MDQQLVLSITETSQVAEARRLATKLAKELGFNETEAGKVALVVSEAATNLVKHTPGGQLLVRALKQTSNLGIEILALDQGPGILNIGESLRDGYSTAGSLGTGLGAIARLSDVFDIHSLPGKGTALLAQLWTRVRDGSRDSTQPLLSNPQFPLEIGVICLPKPGEEVSGDGWAVEMQADRCLIMVTDGLGHGSGAAEASLAALRVLAENPGLAPEALIEAAHATLHGTRGAAVAVVEIHLAQEVRFAGIGNIAGTIVAPDQSRHLASHNGIVGHQVRKIQEFIYPWSSEALLVLHSDGLATQWNLDAYPGLLGRHPSLIAGVLYRDFKRGYDDVMVLVVK